MNTAAKPQTWIREILPFVVMCIGMFMALLDIQIVASSLQDIGGGLSAAQDQISWVQTAYLIAEIIMIPLSGWLTRVLSTRWLFTASAAGFTLSSLLCGLAWNIESMIVFRALLVNDNYSSPPCCLIPNCYQGRTSIRSCFFMFHSPQPHIVVPPTGQAVWRRA